MIAAFLQTKYKAPVQTDFESLSMDLMVAAFDVLSCAVARKEPAETVFALKSFLINKLPVLLTSPSLLGPMYPIERAEYCIQQALTRVDNVMFPPPSFGMISENALQDVRQEFLFSCAMHQMLRPESIEPLLGEAPLSQPPDPRRRYVKEDLMNQCMVDDTRISQLIDELDKLNGNAGAIAFTVAEVS
jgi:mediator of RNA polymerase II transcription subunit 5